MSTSISPESACDGQKEQNGASAAGESGNEGADLRKTLRDVRLARQTQALEALLREEESRLRRSRSQRRRRLAAESIEEGRFLIAILNSEVLRARVAPRQSRGQWGARDFDKLLAEAIPPFDPNNSLHKALVEAAEHAERVAAQVGLPENIHFVRARQMIRKALREDGVAQRIDEMVNELLG